MPTYTAPLLNHITTAALDYWMNKGTAFKEAIQEKPLLASMESKKKTFPGGKGNIIISVKGDYGNTGAPGTADQLVGYQLDDAVTYYTPANLTQAIFPWKEMHIGIMLTHSELKTDGITVVDSGDMSDTKEHSGRDDTVLVGLLEDALEDVSEQYARGMNNLLWTNGTADPKALAGMAALITDTPGTGIVAGIDRATRPWWRNRAYTAAMGTAVGGTPALGCLGRRSDHLRHHQRRRADHAAAEGIPSADPLRRQAEHRVLRLGLAGGARDRASRQRQLLDDRLLRKQGHFGRPDLLHGDRFRVRPDARRARQEQALLLV